MGRPQTGNFIKCIIYADHADKNVYRPWICTVQIDLFIFLQMALIWLKQQVTAYTIQGVEDALDICGIMVIIYLREHIAKISYDELATIDFFLSAT